MGCYDGRWFTESCLADLTPIVRDSVERATVIKPTDYSIDELRFAYCYHVYLRWRTHRGKPSAQLKNLDRETADGLVAKYSIRVLECESGADESRLLVSLRPDESVAVAEGKIKGQVGKWLRRQSGERFSRGYFAGAVGRSTAARLDDFWRHREIITTMRIEFCHLHS